MIACFLSNISAKYYKNPSMLSRVIAKNVGDVFLRHGVCRNCRLGCCSACLRITVTDNIGSRSDEFVVLVLLGLC